MSLVEGLASVLRDMSLGELALALAAILAYSLAINGSYSAGLRSGAASVAFASAVGFSTISSGWMSAIVFLAMAVVGIAGFAGVAWALSSLLGLSGLSMASPSPAFEESPTFASTASPAVRAFAPHTSAQPL